MEAITLENLAIGYKEKRVLSEISFSIPEGALVALIGANGVGKSTLLRTLAGFQKPLSGQLLLQGKEIGTLSNSDLSTLVSVVLTQKPDVTNITVEELVGLGRSPYTGFWGSLSKADRQIVTEALRLVGISSLKGRMIQTLSDGERQKAMIAKALAQQTPIVLLDEPTAFLDYPSKVEMMQLLHRLAAEKGKTILLSTHDLELAFQLADTLLYMGDAHLRKMEKRELEDYLANVVNGEE
jgi:iron complex transport system ATP-binding protein